MPENYLVIEDFKGGEDTRRFTLSSPAGALRLARNVHVTPGGELEKRKAFTQIVESAYDDRVLRTLQSGTFGLQKTSSGLVVFGSRASTANVTNRARASNIATLTIDGLLTDFAVNDLIAVTGVGGAGYNIGPGQFIPVAGKILSVAAGVNITYANGGTNEASTPDTGGSIEWLLPSEFIYQRLQHPAVLAGTAYDASKHAMTAIIHSEVFGGLAYAVATFADGYSFVYYDGVLVADFVDGLVLPYMNTNAKIAARLAAAITANGLYTVSYTPGNAYLDVTGDFAADFSVETDIVSALGTLSQLQTANTVAPIQATSASGSFRIIAGTDNNHATGNISGNATNVSNGDTVTIGTKVYTYKTTLSAVATEGEVHIGADKDSSLLNLIRAINHIGTYGIDHWCAAINPDVSSDLAVSAHGFNVLARLPGTAGNAIVTTETSAVLAWGSGTLTGGLDSNAITRAKVYTGSIGGPVVSYDLFDVATPVLWTESNTKTASLIAARINAYVASQFTATSNGDKVVITAEVPGVTFNGANIEVDTTGTVCIGNLALTFVGTSFTLQSLSLNGIDIKGAMSGGLSLSDYGNSLAAFVTALSQSINAPAGVFSSCPVGSVLYLTKRGTLSEYLPTNCEIVFSAQGTGSGATFSNVPDNMDLPFVVLTEPDSVVITKTTGAFASGPVKATPANGIAPYGPYLWQEESTGSGNGIVIGSPSTAQTQFTKTLASKQTLTGRFVCKVRDAGGNFAYSNAVVITFVRN